ncbi:MAG: DUF1573 domain-containing protein [Bacteroidia bacterium]|nr:DUF1573 domain-containing protein [Bacteroidia bacterium]
MKRLVLASALVCGLCLSTFAQEKKEVPPKQVVTETGNTTTTPASNADIKFEKMVHDFGNVKWGGNGDCEFKFTNTGKDPLIISLCQGSCGCTVPTCPKEPILPGKTNSMKVHYDTKRPGPITKQVTVTSNAKSGQVILKITGTVEAQPIEEPFPTEKKPNNGTPFEKGN